ncbi:MAG: hypothetical protein KatS3mg076_2766 [Candidatus Binatia bacterium]|nr:MAG: hypothetical protein KatS3mg076_2766 [Candidatus Binatia bacterium]
MWTLLRKDLLIELRTRETLASLLLLGLLVLLTLSFALDAAGELRAAAAPGALWVALVFAGVLGMHRSFLLERENDCLEGLLLAPCDRGTLFLAKFVANFLFLAAAETVMVPVFVVFFDVTPDVALLRLAVVLLLGVAGFAGMGTLFAAISVQTRAREVLLPLLLLPLSVPLLVAGVTASEVLLAGANFGSVRLWLAVLVAYDVVSLVVGWWLFEYAVTNP